MHSRTRPLLALIALAVGTGCTDAAAPLSPDPVVEPETAAAHQVWVEAVTGAAHAFGTLNGVPFPRNLQFNARRSVDGDVVGHFQLLTGIVQWRGPVLCFEIVSDTQVRIGGLAASVVDPRGILFGDVPPPQGVLEVFAIVTDNGEGSGTPPDTTSPVFIGGPGTAAAGCAGEFDGSPDVELSSGNVQIHHP